MNLVESYFWFKEDGVVLINEWKNCFSKDLDLSIKIKHFNENDLKKYFAIQTTCKSLWNIVNLTDFKRDIGYCKIVLNQFDGMIKTYSSNSYFIDFKDSQTVMKNIEGLEYLRIINYLEDLIRYSIRHCLFEIRESSL